MAEVPIAMVLDAVATVRVVMIAVTLVMDADAFTVEAEVSEVVSSDLRLGLRFSGEYGEEIWLVGVDGVSVY